MKLDEINPLKHIGDRTMFNESWLSEMPEGLGTFETFDMLEYNIKDFIKHGIKAEDLGNNLKKISAGSAIVYWYEKDGQIQLGTELHKEHQCLVVRMTGKNPKLKGKAPYASDLYSAILKDTDKSIRMMSDKTLSDEGYNIWKNLFKLGHTITLYDTSDNTKVGHSMVTFYSIEEMDKYFKNDDTSYQKYQYVLSENLLKCAEVRNEFNIRRYRESVPKMSLTD
jgi:hypothetical protein